MRLWVTEDQVEVELKTELDSVLQGGEGSILITSARWSAWLGTRLSLLSSVVGR